MGGGGGWRPTSGEWTWCHGWVPLQGAIGGRVTTNFGGVDVVPLLGAIAGCHCSVLWVGEEGDGQLCGSGRGAIVVCYGWGAGWPTLGEWTWCYGWGAGWSTLVDVVPLQGAIVVGCRCDDRAIAGCPWHPTQQWHPEKASRKSAFNFCRRYIVLCIDNTIVFLPG